MTFPARSLDLDTGSSIMSHSRRGADGTPTSVYVEESLRMPALLWAARTSGLAVMYGAREHVGLPTLSVTAATAFLTVSSRGPASRDVRSSWS